MMTNEQRDRVVAETQTWIGTPYRGWTCRRSRRGLWPAYLWNPQLRTYFCDHSLPKDYPLFIGLHRASTEYVDLVFRYFREIPESEVQPGDVVVWR